MYCLTRERRVLLWPYMYKFERNKHSTVLRSLRTGGEKSRRDTIQLLAQRRDEVGEESLPSTLQERKCEVSLSERRLGHLPRRRLRCSVDVVRPTLWCPPLTPRAACAEAVGTHDNWRLISAASHCCSSSSLARRLLGRLHLRHLGRDGPRNGARSHVAIIQPPRLLINHLLEASIDLATFWPRRASYRRSLTSSSLCCRGGRCW